MRTGVLHEKPANYTFKARAYKTAIDACQALSIPITSVEDVKGLPGIGEKILEKITEIITTGTLAAANRVEQRIDLPSLKLFEGVHGIGPVKAKQLVDAGYKTIKDLGKATTPKLFTAAQTLGLKHYEAGLQRIPRSEMITFESQLLSHVPAHLTGILTGSYRRGASSSGDIDMLLKGNGSSEDLTAFATFVACLKSTGLIVDQLISGPKKWMGYAQLPGGLARRLDLMLTPPEEYAYAILYFTGSDKFNVAFRNHCLSLHYSLNEHTLSVDPKWKGTVPPSAPPMTKEEDIFAFVGLQYIEPTARVDGAQIIKL